MQGPDHRCIHAQRDEIDDKCCDHDDALFDFSAEPAEAAIQHNKSYQQTRASKTKHEGTAQWYHVLAEPMPCKMQLIAMHTPSAHPYAA